MQVDSIEIGGSYPPRVFHCFPILVCLLQVTMAPMPQTNEEKNKYRQEIVKFLKDHEMNERETIQHFKKGPYNLTVGFIRKAMLAATGSKKPSRPLFTNEEREKYRQEIRKYLEEHEMNRTETLKHFRVAPYNLSVTFIRKAMSRIGLQPRTLDDNTRELKVQLNKKVLKFLIKQGPITKKAIEKTYDHFTRQGIKKRFVRTALFNNARELARKLDSEAGEELVELVKSVKFANLRSDEETPRATNSKEITSSEKKRQVSFSENTIENSDKSLHKVPPTPKTKTPAKINGSPFSFEEENNIGNSSEDEYEDAIEQDASDADEQYDEALENGEDENEEPNGSIIEDKFDPEPRSTSPMSGLKLKTPSTTPASNSSHLSPNKKTPNLKTPESVKKTSLSHSPAQKSPFPGVAKTTTSPNEQENDSMDNSSVEEGDIFGVMAKPKTILRKTPGTKSGKRVSWGKNSVRQSDLIQFTPAKRQSINLMSFETPAPAKKAAANGNAGGDDNDDDQPPQLVPIDAEIKKKVPLKKFSPRLTRSAAKKKTNN